MADTRRKRILFATPPLEALPPEYIFEDTLCALCFSPDEKILASASIRHPREEGGPPWRFYLQITLRNAQNGVIIKQWTWDQPDALPLEGLYSLGRIGLAFAPDGRSIAVADNRQITLWSVSSSILPAETGVLLGDLKGDDSFDMTKHLIFFRNRPLLASSGWGDKVKIWNYRSGTLEQVFYGHMIDMMTLSPDERLLATTGQKKDGQPELRVWDVSKL